ncbi:MAG: response regulator transcription factor [Phenylobacterium sp.]|uniref:response regulator n=1 Tax=Phenylobacterium sp. TaxID=1871053 RepID=UPI0025E0392A|nr:response regulator transcription factor [Phenylobacterium sp.]MCG9917123.1 response regulator transcription factor [Phenylobacterium sp.]
MTPPARLLIVDDHPLAREGLRSILTTAGFEIVAEAHDGLQALELAKALTPDLILMDIRLGVGMDGLETASALRAQGVTAKIMMLTLHDDPEYVRAALAAGATGYVLKDAGLQELSDAVAQVLKGQVAIPVSLLSSLATRPSSQPRDMAAMERLTDREREVLDLIAEGMTNKAIARTLQISPSTVKAHVERVISKLGVADRTQAAVMVARRRDL